MHRLLVIGVVALAGLVPSAPAAAWTWPADGAVLRPFGLGADPYAGGQHRGIDVAGVEGAAIRAPASGTVTFAGSLPTYGRGMTIQTESGYLVTLVHLGALEVEKGAVVAEGVADGTFRPDVDPKVASIFILSILNAVERWYRPDGPLDRRGLAEMVFETMMTGLG